MAAHNLEIHHRVPRCLVRFWDAANEGDEITGETIEAALSWEEEAMRWSVPVEISREDLAALVVASTVPIPVEEHTQEDPQRSFGLRPLGSPRRARHALALRDRLVRPARSSATRARYEDGACQGATSTCG